MLSKSIFVRKTDVRKAPTVLSKSDIAALSEPIKRERKPLDILMEQNQTRLSHLVPVRMGRMLESPFAYYRGTAGVMAADLATVPNSSVHMLICGDAHISNFGFYASPERKLLFDLNDFDESGYGPWEWDLKRLMASVYLAALDNKESEETAFEITRKTSKYYRETLLEMLELDTLERFYYSVDADNILPTLTHGKMRKQFEKITNKARTRNSAQALAKFAVREENGSHRIVDQPPLTMHSDALSKDVQETLWGKYINSASSEIRYLLQSFDVVDQVLRVVGVGSVGTRCYISLLEDVNRAPLFLQIKEAQTSVLYQYGKMGSQAHIPGGNEIRGNGYRVVASQKVLQAQSDMFLGWVDRIPGHDGLPRDYYVRQFRDMKGSINLAALDANSLKGTAKLCASLLARAHAQSHRIGDIAIFAEGGKPLDIALAQWSKGYAQQCMKDFENLKYVAEKGVVPVQYGL